ncbi:MAG: hypothetical protein LJF15_06005 [Acidobacteria bacterium]|jgi:hypothetical protein|nr:hypothetical protein [Acidobacteriota bacterium]
MFGVSCGPGPARCARAPPTRGLTFDSYFGPVFLGASVGNGGSTRLFFTFGTLIHQGR